MKLTNRTVWQYLLPAMAVCLPAFQLLLAFEMLQKLEQQREVFLRTRTAAVAARLETLASGLSQEDIAAVLLEEEPLLSDLRLVLRTSPDANRYAQLWDGRELFRTERVQDIYRATVPFHAEGELRLAVIEVPFAAGDFLVLPAQRNMIVSTALGLVVVTLAFATAWAFRRSAAAEQHRLELEYLAEIGRMTAVLAHEIRNPLGTMKGFAQLLKEGASEAQRALIDPIIDESRRLEALVRDLLLFGRPRTPALEQVELASFTKTLKPHLPSWFEITVPDRRLRTDPQLLEQALLNVLRNACEATATTPDPHGRLIVSEERGRLRWSVEDNGPGFSTNALEHLFTPFHTTKAAGTGLGLAVTRKLVSSLGGTIEVSNGRERGARVDIVLPVND